MFSWSSALSPHCQDNITRAGAIPPLISLLDQSELRELAAAVLAKLAHEHEDNQSAIGAATGAVPKLWLDCLWSCSYDFLFSVVDVNDCKWQ